MLGDHARATVADGDAVDLHHGGHVGRGARHEHLVSDVQLRPVDRAALHLQAELALRDVEGRLQRDALQDVVAPGRRHQHALADHDDVLARSFRDVPVLVKHDRLVEAVELGLGLRHGVVDVKAVHLGAGRDHRVIDATPGGGGAACASVRVQVGAEGGDEDQELVLQVVHAHTHHLGGLVDHRADVDVLLVAVARDRLQDDVAHLVLGVRDGVHAHDLGALADAADMIADLEEVQLLLVGVPVAAYALEDRGPVVEGVRHDVDVRLRQRDELALEERSRVRHLGLLGPPGAQQRGPWAECGNYRSRPSPPQLS